MARQAMMRLGAVLVILLIAFVVAEVHSAPSKAKKVKCQDRKFYKCYHQDLYCPAACLRTCVVDCKKCKAVCKAPPPPPPPPPRRKWRYPPPPPPKRYHQSPPPPPKSYHHLPPPPPKSYHHSPPPPPKSYHHSPPPPPKSYHHSPPPPPKSYHHSPPPPPKGNHNSPPPPPKSSRHSPPPPPKSYPSPPPPPSVVPTPPPTTTTPPLSPPIYIPPPSPSPIPTPSPPLSTPSSPPPPSTPTPSPPFPPTSAPPSSYPPLPPPSPEGAGGKKVRCKNKNYPHCYGLELSCPSGCPDQCEVDCVTCSPVCNCNKPGAVCQDPRFIGGDGLTFYFHGKRDQDFCLVSDSNLHINAHFIGKRNQTMGRDFTWVQSLGILFDDRRFFIGAKPTSTWDDTIDRLTLAIDDEAINLPDYEGAYWQSQGLRITRSKNTNAVEIEAEGNFKIKAVVVPITEKESVIHKYGITQENCFAHLDLSFKFYALSEEVTGVLGQTYGENYVSRVKMGVMMPVLGGDKAFASSSIFSSDCSVARFSGEFSESNGSDRKNSKYANAMNCASGMDGRGVVCKR